jgi:imidazolonepropionase
MPTLLPTTAFFLRIPYAPARKMLDAGLPIALASDYNPGTSPSGNMNFVVATACTQMKLLPREALAAATLNAAHSLQLGHLQGSLAPGKEATFLLTERGVASHLRIPYSFGRSLIEHVYVRGKRIR